MKFRQNKYKLISDAQLMVSISKGNEGAFNELYTRYAQRMFAYFYKMLYQDKDLAADFSQTLFLKVFEKASSFNKEYALSTWIYSIAFNMCKNEYRRQSRPDPVIHMKLQAFDVIQPKAPGNIDAEIFQKHLQHAINELEPIQKQCFILRYQEDLSIKEIAAILECPPGTVKSRLFYALRKLSKKLVMYKPNTQKKSNEGNSK